MAKPSQRLPSKRPSFKLIPVCLSKMIPACRRSRSTQAVVSKRHQKTPKTETNPKRQASTSHLRNPLPNRDILLITIQCIRVAEISQLDKKRDCSNLTDKLPFNLSLRGAQRRSNPFPFTRLLRCARNDSFTRFFSVNLLQCQKKPDKKNHRRNCFRRRERKLHRIMNGKASLSNLNHNRTTRPSRNKWASHARSSQPSLNHEPS